MLQPWPKSHVTDDPALYPMAVGTFDADVMAQLEAHIADEQHLIDEYDSLMRGSDHAPVHYLLGLVLEDDARHHRIRNEMLKHCRSSVASPNKIHTSPG
jgi:hypothetical protein